VVVPAVGGPHPAWLRHDGTNAMTAHQSLTDHASAPGLQFDMNTGAAIAPAIVAMNLLDVLQNSATPPSAPARPRGAPPTGAVPNRAGQVPWLPTRSSDARNRQIDRLPLIFVRK
jgi:hypothetical protein